VGSLRDLERLGYQTVTGDSHLSRQPVMLMPMDAEPRPVTGPIPDGQGSYLWRAQTLLTARADLFMVPSRRAAGATRPAGAGPDLGRMRDRAAARQLILPLPRERRRRRARMLG
jgi:hypothetical protein